MTPRPRLGVSACLLGQRVRHDGDHKREAFLATLGRLVEWVPVCPEVELGLGIPREPIQLEGHPGTPRLIALDSRTDHTPAMTRFARDRVEQLRRLGLAGYVLKAGSPSCGMARVPVHGARGRSARRGTGLVARALMERLPLLPVEEEGRLRDPALRRSFVARIFAYARWQRAMAAGMTRRRLRAFHAAHAALLLAHDPAAARRLDALVTKLEQRPLRIVVATYGAHLKRALRKPPTMRRR